MDRRRFLAGAVGILAAPLAAEAQQARVYRVGVVLHGSPYYSAIDGLRDGLRELGFEEGKQFVLSVRDTKGDLKSADALARSLEGENVDLIYAVTASAAVGVKRGAKSVPIVFYAGSDPVALGLVGSLRHPGGRLTGLYGQFTELTPKRFELLKEMVPRLRRVLVFYNPDNPVAQRSVKIAREAASSSWSSSSDTSPRSRNCGWVCARSSPGRSMPSATCRRRW